MPGTAPPLAYRPRSALPMDPSSVPGDAMLLLDTTVYIDSGKRQGLPPPIEALLANRVIRHSTLCIGELAFGYGRLDPAHGGTPRNRDGIARLLDMIDVAAVVDLSPSGWSKAGALAGALTRMQGFTLDRRRAMLIGAAIFVTAQEAGLTLVSGNLAGMDLLLQVGGPAGMVLYQT